MHFQQKTREKLRRREWKHRITQRCGKTDSNTQGVLIGSTSKYNRIQSNTRSIPLFKTPVRCLIVLRVIVRYSAGPAQR